MSRVVIAGEAMVEITESSDGVMRRGFGGDTFNTAIHLARRPGDQCVHYVSTLGDDELSQSLVTFATAEGVDMGGVAILPSSHPGLYMAHIDDSGERTFSYWRGQSAARTTLGDSWPAAQSPDPDAIDLLVFSGISLAVFDQGGRQRLLELAEDVVAAGGRVAYDPNHRATLWESDEAVGCLERVAATGAIVSIGSSDGDALLGITDTTELARVIRELGSDETVVRDGPRPSLCSWADSTESVAASIIRTVVDTTAAGDSFNAAYIAARLADEPPPIAARLGHELAADVVQHIGAIEAGKQT